MVGNLPLVDVGFDGHPAKLVLDTGAEQVIVRDTSFERLGLERNYQALASVTGIGAQSSIYPSRPAALSIGPVRLPPEAMLVTAIPITLRGGIEPDGLLGSQVLSAYDVDIDMPSRRLGLYERRRCPDGPPPIDGATNIIRAQGNRAWKLTVPVTLDGGGIGCAGRYGGEPHAGGFRGGGPDGGRPVGRSLPPYRRGGSGGLGRASAPVQAVASRLRSRREPPCGGRAVQERRV